jgi:hypothetical protein
MGFAAGFQVGASAVERGLKMRDENELKARLAEAYQAPTTGFGYTSEEMARMRQMQGAGEGAYNIEAVPGSEGGTPTLRYTPTGLNLGSGDMPEAPTNFAPQQIQRYGDQAVAGQFSPAQLRGLQAQAAARAVGASGDYRGAALLQQQAEEAEFNAKYRPLQLQSLEGQIAGQAQQSALTGLQLTAAQTAQAKSASFDTAFATINSTKYDKPEDKDAAVLSAVAQFKGPEAAAALQANYSTNERNKILTDGAKFDQTIKQARVKGPAAALKAIDELNDSFTLEIDGFKVTQVNKDGTRVPFLSAKNADEFALSVDSRIKEGGAFELAKFRQDEQSKNALIAYYNAKAKEAGVASSAAANQLSGVQVGYSRDEKGNPIQVMSALRFNKRTGELESVQVQLDQNVVPPSALDPKKIADQANELVGQSIDPTNKKSKEVHTFATAQQAVVDQIFNQYLGTGKPAGGLDLSPAAIAERARQGATNLSPVKPAAATLQTPTNLGIDPNRPQSSINPVTGQPRETPGSGPNLVAAVSEGLDAGQARYVKYLESKIANNQPLTADEQIRAKRFGLQ